MNIVNQSEIGVNRTVMDIELSIEFPPGCTTFPAGEEGGLP
jgi:hypothetical protein